MLFRKKESSERMREYFSAPSFFMPEGVLMADSPRKLREIARGCACIVFPLESALLSPHEWVSALASADYAAVVGDKSIMEFAAFMKGLDSIIFSPVPRALAGAVIVPSYEKALEYAKASGSEIAAVIIGEDS